MKPRLQASRRIVIKNATSKGPKWSRVASGARLNAETPPLYDIQGKIIFDQAACEAAKGRALAMGAQFVDARTVPFMLCRCGYLLAFTTVDSCEPVM